MTVPGKCQPKTYRYKGKLVNVHELSTITGAPVSTLRGFVAKAQQNEKQLADLIAARAANVKKREEKIELEDILYPCPDGKVRKVKELVKKYPHMSQWKLDHRMKYLEEVGINKVFCTGKFDHQKPGETGMDLSQLSDLPPRRDITEVRDVGSLERKYL